MGERVNRRILLAARPRGLPGPEHFRLVTEPVAEPSDGEVLLRTLYLSLDPYMRNLMDEVGPGYAPRVEPGSTMVGATVSRVEKSRNASFREGELVLASAGWQDYAISDGNSHGMFAQDALQGLSVAWHYAVEALVFVGGGTLLATGIRHFVTRDSVTRRGFEGLLITLAVISGFFLWDAADRWADDHHAELMCAIHSANCEPTRKPIDSTLLGLVMQASVPAGLYFLFGGGVAIFSYARERRGWAELQRRREREGLELRAREADARLAILQAQVEPHFLFNALASLRSLVRTDPDRAEATIDALVAHLRATLPKFRAGIEETESTLGQQLEICRSYLEVMRVRMGTRLRYEINVPEALREQPFPPLMLLLLVENAIKHGIEPSRSGGHVVVSLRQIRGAIAIDVRNSLPAAHAAPSSGHGIGLSAVRSRIEAFTGGRGGLEVSRAEDEHVVTLILPAQDSSAGHSSA